MLRFLTAGESHGPVLTGILEGMPAGMPLSSDDIDRDLLRRQEGYGSGGRMQIERDHARITGGVMNGFTTGGPISLLIENRDWKNWAQKDITPMTTPRPGHADLTGTIKYGYRDLRLALERSSARETAVRVAVGAIGKRLLAEFGITVGGYVTEIGGEIAQFSDDPPDYPARFAAAEESEVRCPDPDAAARIQAAIRQAKIDKDTLGGVIEVVALGLPAGLGSHVHYDRRLTGRLAGAVCSVQSIKGVEIGPAFENTRKRGTQVHDEIRLADEGRLYPRHQSRGRVGRRHDDRGAADRARRDETDQHDPDAARFGQSGDRAARSDGLRAQRLLRHAARRRRDRGDGRAGAGRRTADQTRRRQPGRDAPPLRGAAPGAPGRSADG